MTTTNNEQPSQPKKLVLKKETLRQLTTGELRAVAGGGAAISYNCSGSPTC